MPLCWLCCSSWSEEPSPEQGAPKAPLLFAVCAINCSQLSYLLCCSIYWCLWSAARGAVGWSTWCLPVPQAGDGSQAFHPGVPRLGHPSWHRCGCRGLHCSCSASAFVSLPHLSSGSVRKVSCVSNSLGIPL